LIPFEAFWYFPPPHCVPPSLEEESARPPSVRDALFLFLPRSNSACVPSFKMLFSPAWRPAAFSFFSFASFLLCVSLRTADPASLTPRSREVPLIFFQGLYFRENYRCGTCVPRVSSWMQIPPISCGRRRLGCPTCSISLFLESCHRWY